MTHLLHIESATKACSVAISLNGEPIALVEEEKDGFQHGEKLNIFIEEALQKAKIKLKNLSGISIASGPGSYTGLRIGTATAKGLCFALDIPLIAIDTLTCLTEIGKKEHPNVNLCAVVDARRMEVYNHFVNPKGALLKAISADVITENSYAEFEPFVYFGDGAEKLTSLWKNRNCKIDTSIRSSAKGQCGLAYQKFLSKEFEDTAYFEPFYLKDFITGKK